MTIKIKICNSDSGDGPNFIQNSKFYFSEYCSSASIHGLKFLGEKGRTWIEKLFWLISLSTSLYFCISLILQIYHKWENSPVIVTFATTQTPIWKIPFPAVTICPEIKSQRDIYNYTEEILKRIKGNLSESEENEFKKMHLVCPGLFKLFDDTEDYDEINDTALEFLIKVSPPLNDTLFYAMWLDKDLLKSEDELQKIFSPVITSEGICYSFNLLDANDIFSDNVLFYEGFDLIDENPSLWTVEGGYDDNAGLDAFPRRTMLSGLQGGLDLILKTRSKDIDPLCTHSVPGYKILFNYPAEVPIVTKQYFRVPLDQDVIAVVKPNMMTASNDLKNYNPEARQCYFTGEKKLKLFKIYNQQNCLFECLTNFTESYCDCVAFYMPRDNSTPICGPFMSDCLSDAEVQFLAGEVTSKLDSTKKRTKKVQRENNEKYITPEECNCLPSCNSIEFETETSQSAWDWKTTVAALDLVKDMEGISFSRLRVSFKDMQFITSERNQLYGQTDFWANCGGLLGLFTGFSFISVVEILYYLTLRVICNIRKFGRRYWSGASELLEEQQQN